MELLGRGRVAEEQPLPDPDTAAIPDDASGLDDSLPRDSGPGQGKRRTRTPRVAAKATAAQKRQVKDTLHLVLTLMGGAISLRDSICGPALSEQAEAVADAMVPIICRNPALLAWFSGGSNVMDFMALGAALQPLLATAWKHHGPHRGDNDSAPRGGVPVDYSVYSAQA